MRVKKALQGHPESTRLWTQLIDKIIQDLNLHPCKHEPNLYYSSDYMNTGKRVLFLPQVDDFAVCRLMPRLSNDTRCNFKNQQSNDN